MMCQTCGVVPASPHYVDCSHCYQDRMEAAAALDYQRRVRSVVGSHYGRRLTLPKARAVYDCATCPEPITEGQVHLHATVGTGRRKSRWSDNYESLRFHLGCDQGLVGQLEDAVVSGILEPPANYEAAGLAMPPHPGEPGWGRYWHTTEQARRKAVKKAKSALAYREWLRREPERKRKRAAKQKAK